MKKTLFLFIYLIQVVNASEDILINKNASWKYLDNGSNQFSAWNTVNFDDSSWLSGNAKLGFGGVNNSTVLNNHQSPTQTGAATWYFRKVFTIDASNEYAQIKYNLLRDDGAVIYLNGVEIGRSNMPSGEIDYQTLAIRSVFGDAESEYIPSEFIVSNLTAGQNVIAVEIHQRRLSDSDIGFNFELSATTNTISRGPYLQSQSPESIVIKWRTVSEENSRIIWGIDVDNLTNTLIDETITTEHEMTINGLIADSKIYYSVGTTSTIHTSINDDYSFIVPPTHGSHKPVRLWVLGDSGTANSVSRAVRDAYYNYQPETKTNLWLMLGDNAYTDGADAEYQKALFEMYPTMLSSSTLWSTIGNHERVSANSITETGVYYDVFTFPKTARTDGFSTGADSGTEAYYSFDYANIHFIVLESSTPDNNFRTGMINWLTSDLAESSSDWTIALWHHPPYAKGSHDSDSEGFLSYTRENFLPLLENKGIDLVLSGHSHAYERSWLIDSHYGVSETFNPIFHVVSNNPTQYTKPILGQNTHAGTIYVVNGTSGTNGVERTIAHPAMRNLAPLAQAGSLVIDVNAGVMEVKFLNSEGQISDEFSIHKGDLIFSDGFDN